MSARSLDRTRSELSEFLVRRRGMLGPGDVGLPPGGRRRTPGLRREEVASLAGVGLTWYTWFEQGRDIRVSEKFLLGVARALRLDDAECSRLFLLAHKRPPPTEARQWTSIGPLVQQLMDDLVLRPAYVLNLRWDAIAWNPAADDLLGFGARTGEARNLLRLVFADPDMRRRLPTWHDDAPKLLARFRYDFAVAPDDAAMLALVEELKTLSPDFRRWWERPDDQECRHGIGAILAADGRRLDFRHETLVVDPHRHLSMVVYFGERREGPAPGWCAA